MYTNMTMIKKDIIKYLKFYLGVGVVLLIFSVIYYLLTGKQEQVSRYVGTVNSYFICYWLIKTTIKLIVSAASKRPLGQQ